MALRRQPPLHRAVRRLTVAGLPGTRTAWRLIATLVAWPDDDIVSVGPGIPIVWRPDEYLSALAYRGLYERAETAIVQRLVRPGGFVIDVGANLGYYTALLAHLVGPTGHVVAFEPSPMCVPALRRLVMAADLGNVTIHASAVGASAGTAVLRNAAAHHHTGLATLRGDVEADGETTEVTVVALADVPEIAAAPEIDLVKIDVEGLESEVLDGASPLFDAARVRLAVVEVSPNFGPVDYAAEFLERRADDYAAFAVEERRTTFGRRARLTPLTTAAVRDAPAQFNMLVVRRDALTSLPKNLVAT